MDTIKTRDGYTPPSPDLVRIDLGETFYALAVALSVAGDDREAMFR
ncbi:hypothetical protein [Leifsonia aquatica]|nr:hypothetical protein [Leifsonia aquatica]